MTKPLRGQTVLIVDEDLGFVWWLGQVLAEAGHQAVPALDTRQAVSHIRQFNMSVDVVIVHPGTAGVATLLKTLARTNKQIRIIAIRNPGDDPSVPGPAHAILERPGGWEPISREEWLRKVRKALADAHAAPKKARSTSSSS